MVLLLLVTPSRCFWCCHHSGAGDVEGAPEDPGSAYGPTNRLCNPACYLVGAAWSVGNSGGGIRVTVTRWTSGL